jgi:hypothetical protein
MGRSVTGDKTWTGESAPEGTAIHYALGQPAAGDVTVTITDPLTGEAFRTLEGTGDQGMNRVRWDLRGEEPPREEGGGGGFGGRRAPMATPGVYFVTLSVNGQEHVTTVRVLTDHWLGQR